MYIEQDHVVGEALSQERRDDGQPNARIMGRLMSCDGSRATITAMAGDGDLSPDSLWTVGKMMSINLGKTRTVCLVYAIESSRKHWQEEADNAISVSVELVGEVRDTARGPVFDRGITTYPHVGAPAHRIRTRDLKAVYDLAGREAVTIGHLSQDEDIDACIAVDDTLNRHFAVVGTTGVGKSSAVTLLLRKTLAARPNLRVLVMDPHNEFGNALDDVAVRIDSETLDLPFWLFRLEELVEVLFRGREAAPEEVELLRDLIPLAKNLYRNPNAGGGLLRRSGDTSSITADTPVPYRMQDVLKEIDERMGALDAKGDRPTFRALKNRIEAALSDPRYRFMFGSRLIEDTIHETVGRIFRIPHHGKPVTCFEMAGLPSEIVNAVCSVLARMSFDLALWSAGRFKLLVMCEEAHRYMPADHRLGFAPTRHSLARIAKEGRKYGCFLGVVTQRPGELDPTILSQCSTVFAMRLANEQDQAIIRSAIADSSASTLSFISAMGQREAIAFGEGVAATMRMKFEQLRPEWIPGSEETDQTAAPEDDDVDLAAIVERMRNVGRKSAPASVPDGLGAPVAPGRQAGDAGYDPSARAPSSAPPVYDDGRISRRFGGLGTPSSRQ